MTRYVAYYRVSTDKQGKSGLGLDAQRQAVTTFIEHSTLIAEFTEIESTRHLRPKLDEALGLCRRQKATLLIARLDRLARNVAFISNLMESHVDFVAVDMPHVNRLTIHILAAVAEHERELISQRTKVALQAAKSRGVKLGNPDPLPASRIGNQVWKSKSAQFRQSLVPLIKNLQERGYSLHSIAREFNYQNIPSACGGLWYARTIKNLMKKQD